MEDFMAFIGLYFLNSNLIAMNIICKKKILEETSKELVLKEKKNRIRIWFEKKMEACD